jgi:hypothetical protein
VPIQVRCRLSLEQREHIKTASVQFELNIQTGEYTATSVDQEKMTAMSLLSLIVSWPFTYADGKPVPVSAEAIRKLGPTMTAMTPSDGYRRTLKSSMRMRRGA